MSTGKGHRDPGSSRHRRFATTHWSVVVAAGQGSAPEARQALASLCADYWYPLYAYVRRRGYQTAEAQDLTQGFFAQLLEKETIQAADQSRGKFRAFLLSSLDHYMANQWRHDRAEKRGGGRLAFSLDLADGEQRYHHEPTDTTTPERIFDRRWAMTLLDKAIGALRDEYVQADKLVVFDTLKIYLGGRDSSVPYRDIARRLDTSEGAVKVAVHRMRQQCRECLRREIAQTVASSDEIDDELRHLFQAVQS